MEQLDLVSVHFAKSGGSSLARALANHYGQEIFWDSTHDPCNASHDASEPPDLPANTRAVHGHFRGDRYASYNPRILFTFLREPVDKLISVYFFWKSLPPSDSPDHLHFLRENPSILEYAHQTAGVACTAYFGGMDMRDFDMIGFHDRREQDLAILSGAAGFPIPPELHLNRTPSSPERSKVLRDPALLADLRRALQEDVDFYDTVRAQRLGE